MLILVSLAILLYMPNLLASIAKPTIPLHKASFGSDKGGILQTLPRKVEGHLCVVAPRYLCLDCGSGGPYLGHVPLARRRLVGPAASR